MFSKSTEFIIRTQKRDMYKLLLRPVLFLFDPEKVHYFTFSLIRIFCKIPYVAAIFRGLYLVNDKKLERTLFGITFKNPVGLACKRY